MSRAAAIHLLCLSLYSCHRREPLGEFNAVPDFELTDQSGARFESALQLKGKVWIADFIFTNCAGPCPRMGSQMRQVQSALTGQPGIRLVSFSVDPKRDTPEVLSAYAKRYSAQPGRWFFLTGSPDTLNKLSLEAFMLSRVSDQLDHSTRFALVDRQGKVRKYYETTEPRAIPDLIADARELAEAKP
jgi:cytochrome oxidase Cu insertion factor (SCO1/SenC/PrrC family)